MVICKAHGTPRNEAYAAVTQPFGMLCSGGIATLRSQQAQQMAVYRQPPQGRNRSRADSQIL
jgi:hypothetical protein